MTSTATTGRVALVGAGPGDAELITLKGARLLQTAEVVIYDNLVSPGVMDLVAPTAERIFVGKMAGHHTLPQEEICQLLVDKGGQLRFGARAAGRRDRETRRGRLSSEQVGKRSRLGVGGFSRYRHAGRCRFVGELRTVHRSGYSHLGRCRSLRGRRDTDALCRGVYQQGCVRQRKQCVRGIP